jgi:hypothetical protein
VGSATFLPAGFLPNRYIMQGYTSIPFKTESAHGFKTVNGIAKFSSAGVVLEFESKLFGVIGQGVKEVRLPKGDILDVKFRKGFFKVGAKIEIRLRTMAALEQLPSDDGKLSLKLVRDDFARAQAAVEQLQKDMAAYEAGLPPVRTPVSDLFTDDSEDETRQLPAREDK